MDVFPVNWDSVPEVMNKEQFFRICHISKSTALHLLKSGKVPCEWSGKKTRCYKIRKEDVKAYLEKVLTGVHMDCVAVKHPFVVI